MKQRKRLAALLASSALIIGMFGLSTGGVLAADNTQYWQGNGTTDGEIDKVECDESNTAGQLWIWTGDGSNVWINVDGELVQGVQMGQGSFHFATGWHDIGDLTPGDGGNVFVTYDGAVDENAVLTLSHGCPGETEESQPPSEEPSFEQSQEASEEVPSEEPSFEQSQEASEEVPSEEPSFEQSQEASEEVPSDEPSFEQSQEGLTDAPSEPDTATVGGQETGAPSNSAWLLVVALGLLLSSIVVMTPARARGKR
jgi:hypothetical protein